MVLRRIDLVDEIEPYAFGVRAAVLEAQRSEKSRIKRMG